MRWIESTTKAILTSQEHSRRDISDALRVGGREHMSSVDPFDGGGARAGERCKIPESRSFGETDPGTLVTVKPVVDGRMRDLSRT